MKPQQILEDKVKSQGFKISAKLITIAFIILILMIPKMMIMDVIFERKLTSQSAKNEVMNSWSNEQTIRGPILTVPYLERIYDNDNNHVKTIIHQYHFLPQQLTIDGELFPKELTRNIYQSVVYESSILVEGDFVLPDLNKLDIPQEDFQWDKASLSLAISDLRGISKTVTLKWGEQAIPFMPGMDKKIIGTNGISLQLPDTAITEKKMPFSFTLNLKGSSSLSFAPLGEETKVKLRSNWNDPGFQGRFLPTNRSVTPEGFEADWTVLNYNRDFPQYWSDSSFNTKDSDFGVTLVNMADHYQKNERSAKYAILIILLVFTSFFLNEVITKQRVHPFQYILVGFSILIFYLLLLAFSEHIGFNMAYLVAALSVTTMVLFYSRSFLSSWNNSFILSLILIIAFTFIFVLLQLESFALLVGSIGLFVLLGLIMYFTRKINWYS